MQCLESKHILSRKFPVGRGVQVAVLLGSHFGTHLVLKVSNFPEKIVSKGDEHRLARQKVISAWLA